MTSTKKLTNETIDQRLIGRNIIRLEDYKSIMVKIKFKCLKDGYEWYAAPNIILNNKSGCPRCANRVPITNEIVDKRLIGRNIIRLEDFKTSFTKMKFKCLIDEYIWEAKTYSVINNKTGCPKCANNIRLNDKIIDERLIGRNIERLELYTPKKRKIKFKCLKDGHIWNAHTGHILNAKSGCPKCNRSKGELLIEKILDENKIIYENEKTFSTCKYRSLLKFDFYIEESKILIEYQGVQHFEPVQFGSKDKIKAEEQFKKILIKDQIKKEWAANNGYDLIYFTYKDTEQEIIDKLSFIVAFA